MSRRHEAEGRTIHSRAIAELGEEACIVALGVARDLRSGAILPREFWMGSLCGSACCIAGWIMRRLNVTNTDGWFCNLIRTDPAIKNLFDSGHPSDPILAADAIERYVYDGSDRPWAL